MGDEGGVERGRGVLGWRRVLAPVLRMREVGMAPACPRRLSGLGGNCWALFIFAAADALGVR